MDQEEWIIIYIIVGFIILLILIGCYYCYLQRKKNAQPKYDISDNFSSLDSQVHFQNSKNTKVWIGQSGISKMESDEKQLKLKKQYEIYATAMRIATNYCRDPSFIDRERKIRDDLPCIGYRNESKFYYPILDNKLQKEIIGNAILLLHIDLTKTPNTINKSQFDNINETNEITQGLGDFRAVDFTDAQQFRAFRLTFESFDHPYIGQSYELGLSRDKNHLFIFQDFWQHGSLRDHIYNCDLSLPYSEKYNRPGKPINEPLIRKYGRQILEGMTYLSQCGLVHYHLHTGNILIDDNNQIAKLVGIENNFIGFIPRHPYHKHITILKKLYPRLNVELMLFGYVLFEMSTGMESPTPSPLDYLHEIPKKRQLPNSVKQILGRIFGDKSLGDLPTLSDIIADPFFTATNVPSLSTETYDALKEENELADEIRNISILQCYYTYSREALLGDEPTPEVSRTSTSTTISSKRRRKKKKKKKNRNFSAGMKASTSLLTEESLLDDDDEEDDTVTIDNVTAENDNDQDIV